MGDTEEEGSIDVSTLSQQVIEDKEVNPEGYGIDEEFVPVATFEETVEGEEELDETPIGDARGEERAGGEMVEGEEQEELITESGEGETEGEEQGTDEGEESDKEDQVEGSEKQEEERLSEEESIEEEETSEAVEKDKEKVKGEAIKEKAEAEESAEEKGVKFDGPEEETRKTIKKEVIRRRMSIRKKSIFYQDVSRFGDESRKVSGDFAAVQEGILGVEGAGSISSFHEEGEYYYEEEIEEEEEEAIPIDREFYYSIYRSLVPERNTRRMKNNFLHRKMADYFRKRKMEHVLKETDQQIDSQQKYDKKLDSLAELKELDTRERNSITSELDDMRSQRDDQLALLNIHFTTMQNREKEIGTGLINTKTGKEIPEKLVERLIKRQRDKLKEIAHLRLIYIKIRNRVTEKKTALHALDCIGDNLHLIDFEQLKIENQSHTDKIEERDEELVKLRRKCSGAMQCLAHVREKSAALQLDIQQLMDRFDEVEMECNDCRERLNFFKVERDYYRIETDKLIEECGLLTKPKLLRDMEAAIEEVQAKTNRLEDLKQENEKLKTLLQAIKTNLSDAPLRLHTVKHPSSIRDTPKGSKLYRGRPTLIHPTLPDDDVDF